MGMAEQDYMQRLFPEWKEFPLESMTPCIVENGASLQVVFLVMGKETTVRSFADACKSPDVQTDILVFENKPDHKETDLIIRLEERSHNESIAYQSLTSSGSSETSRACQGAS